MFDYGLMPRPTVLPVAAVAIAAPGRRADQADHDQETDELLRAAQRAGLVDERGVAVDPDLPPGE